MEFIFRYFKISFDSNNRDRPKSAAFDVNKWEIAQTHRSDVCNLKLFTSHKCSFNSCLVYRGYQNDLAADSGSK